MNRAWLLVLTVLVAAGGCLWYVLSSEYASGNVYSEYSSQRTDRMGTAALYEALTRLNPKVSRNEIPLPNLNVKGAEVLIIGLPPTALNAEYLEALEAVAKNGNRVVVALNAASWVFDYKKVNDPLTALWRLKIVDSRDLKTGADPDQRARDYVSIEPAPGSGWNVSGPIVSRSLGTGSISLIGGSWAFTNEALRENRDLTLVQTAVGNGSRILFDETHLGSTESGSVMGLVRQFRLQGVLAVVIACALLFIWQSSSPFPPERPSTEDADLKLAAASSSEGMFNLLSHHIPSNQIMKACVAEWRKDRGRLVSSERLDRIESIVAQKAQPLAQWREIRNLLDKKTK